MNASGASGAREQLELAFCLRSHCAEHARPGCCDFVSLFRSSLESWRFFDPAFLRVFNDQLDDKSNCLEHPVSNLPLWVDDIIKRTFSDYVCHHQLENACIFHLTRTEAVHIIEECTAYLAIPLTNLYSFVRVKTGASVCLYFDKTQKISGKLINVDFLVEDGAHVCCEGYVDLEDCDDDDKDFKSNMLVTMRFFIKKNAQVSLNTFFKSISLYRKRNNMNVRFQGIFVFDEVGGVAKVEQGSLLNGENKLESYYSIRHNAPFCKSTFVSKNVFDEKAWGIIFCDTLVATGAIGTDASQDIHTLLLSDGARCNSKPQLKIFCDDVVCRHGSTVGSLDERILFYLQTRGIDQQQAKSILVSSFLGEISRDKYCLC